MGKNIENLEHSRMAGGNTKLRKGFGNFDCNLKFQLRLSK